MNRRQKKKRSKKQIRAVEECAKYFGEGLQMGLRHGSRSFEDIWKNTAEAMRHVISETLKELNESLQLLKEENNEE